MVSKLPQISLTRLIILQLDSQLLKFFFAKSRHESNPGPLLLVANSVTFATGLKNLDYRRCPSQTNSDHLSLIKHFETSFRVDETNLKGDDETCFFSRRTKCQNEAMQVAPLAGPGMRTFLAGKRSMLFVRSSVFLRCSKAVLCVNERLREWVCVRAHA